MTAVGPVRSAWTAAGAMALLAGTAYAQGISLDPAVAAVLLPLLALSVRSSVLDRQRAQRATQEAARLRGSEERQRRLAEAAFEGIMIHDHGIILDANPAMARLCGVEDPAMLVGRNVLQHIAPEFIGLARSNVLSRSEELYELQIRQQHGTCIPVQVWARNIRLSGRDVRVVAIRDISEREQAARFYHLAHHDSLTGLPNRLLFHDRLEQILTRAPLRHARRPPSRRPRRLQAHQRYARP